MAIEITVPKLGLTMEEATLVCWRAAAGEMVKKEQVVLVLETDKVTFEMPSPGAGLLHPVAAPGSRIEVSQVVGYLAADKAELTKLAAQQPAAETAAPVEAAAAAGRTGCRRRWASGRTCRRRQPGQGLPRGAGHGASPWDRPMPHFRIGARWPRRAGRCAQGH